MRALLTTILDLLGLVLIVAALAVWGACLDPNAWVRGFAVAGAGLLLVSWISDSPWRKERK